MFTTFGSLFFVAWGEFRLIKILYDVSNKYNTVKVLIYYVICTECFDIKMIFHSFACCIAADKW